MGVVDKLFKRTWQDYQARGDRYRDDGELGQALEQYRAATTRFDGSTDQRAALGERIARLETRLRADALTRATKHTNAGELDQALDCFESAFGHSVTQAEKDAVEQAKERLLRRDGRASGALGKWLGSGHRGTRGETDAEPSVHYLVTAQHSYTIERYLETWGHPLEGQLEVVPYNRLLSLERLQSGTYIFSDLERLNRAQRSILAALWQRLEDSEIDYRLLNHPMRAKRRYDLLRALHRDGQNEFDIYRLEDLPRPCKIPVFLRHENDHTGSLAGPFTDDDEIDRAVVGLVMAGVPPSKLVAVEFCETADDTGIYRKYAAFRIGDHIFGRHQFFSHNWVCKYPDLMDPEFVAAEAQFVKTNPHEQQLRRIFDIAKVDYGRIDYGVKNGKVQVWEINMNPVVMLRPDKYKTVNIPVQEHVAVNILAAFESLALDAHPRESLLVGLEPDRVREVIRLSRDDA